MCSLPLRHRRQRPQYSVEMQWTASPTATCCGVMGVGADLDHLAGDLVAEHPRRLDAAVAVEEDPHVGAADAGRGDAQEHAVARADGVGHRAEGHLAGALPDRCAQRVQLQLSDNLPPGTLHSPPCPSSSSCSRATTSRCRMPAPSTPRSPDTGLRHIGCKDVGLPQDELAAVHGRDPRQRPHLVPRGRLGDRGRPRCGPPRSPPRSAPTT